MRTTLEFLDAVKRRHQLTSDYQLARFLGVRQQTISSYRRGNSRLDEVMAIKVADALSMDRAHVLACIAAERAKSEQARKAWERAAAATAAVVVAVLLGAEHGAQLVDAVTAAAPSLYIMSNTPAVTPALALALTLLLSWRLVQKIRN